MKIINKILTKIKGEDFELADGLSFSYLIGLLCRRGIMFLRGKFSFVKNKGLFFRGKNVQLRCRKLLVLGRNVSVDSGSYLDASSIEGIKLGNNVSLGKNTVIECSGSMRFLGKGINVGDDVFLGRDCFYGSAGGIKIGADTIIGNLVSFHSENHISESISIPIRLQGVSNKGIIIGENCWIGAKVTILDGVVLGDNCILAAGAVMKSGTYTSNSIYAGIPAKLIKSR